MSHAYEHSPEWYAEVADEIGRDYSDLPPRRNTPGIPGTAPTSRPRLIAHRASEIIESPSPAEIAEGIAWAGCITIVAAESGAGKTFVQLDLAAAISAGLPWHGRQTLQGTIVYLSCESDALGRRLRANRDVQGHRLEHVYVIRLSDPLSPIVTRDGEQRSRGEIDVTEALQTLTVDLGEAGAPPIRLVIVDTIRASMTGSEDSSEHSSAYLRVIRRLLAIVPDAGAILAHHTGWQDGESARKRERGSSAWRGNVDATLYLEAGDYDRETGECPLILRTLKVRDGERPAPLHLIRRTVPIPGEIDRHGQPVTSCVIDRDRRTREDREAERAAEIEAETRATDLCTLRAIAEHPDMATSQERLRLVIGTRKSVVSESITRLVRAGWIRPGRQRQPYTITPAGRAELETS